MIDRPDGKHRPQQRLKVDVLLSQRCERWVSEGKVIQPRVNLAFRLWESVRRLQDGDAVMFFVEAEEGDDG